MSLLLVGIRRSFVIAWAFFALTAQAQPSVIAFHDVTVVDVMDGSLRARQTVLVEGERIAAVGPMAEVTVPERAEIVESDGGFMIPGLWDMHIHAVNNRDWVESFFPLLLANGVTGIRDTWHYREIGDEAAEDVADGRLPGPVRMVVAGNLIDGPARIWPNSEVAYTPEDGRRLADSLHAAGVPFLKVYSSLAPATFHAIAERARAHDLPFVGHVPARVRAADASDAGMKSMEHFMGVLEGCASEEKAILTDFGSATRAIAQGDTSRSIRQTFLDRWERSLATQVEERCRDLARRFIENETWQVPTLTVLRGDVAKHELAAAGDDRLRYLPPPIYRNAWAPWFPKPETEAGPDEPVLFHRGAYERSKEILAMMAEMGVPFLVGTDAPNPWAFPGFGVHDELALLVEAGMTPLQALQAATLNPAKYFGRTDDLGTVEEGKLADLVLLDANPLEDIANTTRIRAVVADGRLYRRDDLDQILETSEREASRPERNR